MNTEPQDNPAAPEFLRRAVDKAKIAGNKSIQTGDPIGTTVEVICNTLIDAIGREGFGFAHSSFAPAFMRQAQDCALMRQALVEMKVRIETDGSYRDTKAIDMILSRLTPLPS